MREGGGEGRGLISLIFSTAAVWCVPFYLDCSVPWVYVIDFKRKKGTSLWFEVFVIAVASLINLSLHAKKLRMRIPRCMCLVCILEILVLRKS